MREGDGMQYFLDTVETIPEGIGWSLFSGYHFLWLGILAVFAAVLGVFFLIAFLTLFLANVIWLCIAKIFFR